MLEQVGFGNIAEGLVQARPAGAGLHRGARSLHGEIEKTRGAGIAADPVHMPTVDPRLTVREIRRIPAELARGRAEGVEHRVTRIPGLQREIEGLPEILRQEAKRVGPLQGVGGIVFLEHLVAGLAQTLAESNPCVSQRGVIGTVTERHKASVKPRGGSAVCRRVQRRAPLPRVAPRRRSGDRAVRDRRRPHSRHRAAIARYAQAG